ncbi:uncharacterized protein [Henckelia pumila]|uniref:uncharacterized protein isoform X3 n=1 Tax=Henckelia pumila TaxID=405737 RepID=UPI003C6E80F8
MSLHLQMRMGCAEEPSKGVLEGKWILSIEWIKACLNAKEFVEEQHYEITCDIHGIREGPKIGRLRLLNMAHGFPLKELLSKHNLQSIDVKSRIPTSKPVEERTKFGSEQILIALKSLKPRREKYKPTSNHGIHNSS